MIDAFQKIDLFNDDYQFPLIFEWEIFEEKYENSLNDYLKLFPNATEQNFKQEYKKKYKFLIKQKNNELMFKEKFLIKIETSTGLISKKVSAEDLLLNISDSIRNYLRLIYEKYFEINCNLHHIGNVKEFLLFNLYSDIKINYLGEKCNIDYNVLRFLFEIITVFYNRYYIDENRYQILKYDILRIYEFLSYNKGNNIEKIDSNNIIKKDFKWYKLIPHFVNGDIENYFSPNNPETATEVAKKLIQNNGIDLGIEDIRPYIQDTYKGKETSPKNLFRETHLKKINSYCKENNIKITNSKVLDKISDFGIDFN